MDETKKRRYNIVLSIEIHDAIRKQADKEKRSISNMIMIMAIEYLKGEQIIKKR